MSQDHFATFIRREARQQRISATELARQVIFNILRLVTRVQNNALARLILKFG